MISVRASSPDACCCCGGVCIISARQRWDCRTLGGHIGSTTVAFGYDGLGRRMERQTGAGAQTNYWYDQTGMSLETGGTNSTYLRDPGGRLLSRWYSPVHVNYGSDRQGTVTALTNASGGGLENSYRYDPWGSSIGSSGTRYNPMRYTGMYLDESTGLYQMGARFYLPGAGRYTKQDSLPRSVMVANPVPPCGQQPLVLHRSHRLSMRWLDCLARLSHCKPLTGAIVRLAGRSFTHKPMPKTAPREWRSRCAARPQAPPG